MIKSIDIYTSLTYNEVVYEFEWDQHKCVSNISKHGVDFSAVLSVFTDPFRMEWESIHKTGEARYVLLGSTGQNYFTVVYTNRQLRKRVISARSMSREERCFYEER